MGKEKIGIFLSNLGYLGFFYFTEMFIENKLLFFFYFFFKVCFSKTIRRLKVTYMFMVFATSLVVFFLLLCYCRYYDKTFTAMLLVFHCCGYT